MLASLLAQKLSGRMLGDDLIISGIAPLFCVQKSEASVVMWPKDVLLAKKAQAGCLICDIGFAASYADEIDATLIVVQDFFSAFEVLHNFLESGQIGARLMFDKQYVSSSANVHESATVLRASIGDNVYIAPQVLIDNNVSIGCDTHIAAGSVIYAQTRIGNHCHIGPRTVLGSQAFVPYGLKPTRNLCSLGGVEIGDHVSIKAGCTVDRGLIGNTKIGSDSLIDNLVHVGHDVLIGENVLVAAQSGFAGFVRVGDDVTIGGQCGFAPHAVIGDGARISGKTLIHGRVKALQVWSGNPGLPHEAYLSTYKKNLRDARNAK